MLTAQQVRLRASCLKWLPRECSANQSRFYVRPPKPPTARPAFRRRREADDAKPSNDDRREEQPAREPTLLEELFPEEAKKASQTPTRPKERDIPRLDVRSTLPKSPTVRPEAERTVVSPTANNWWNSQAEPREPAAPPPPIDKARQQVGGVLMLRNASKTLIEDDFTRLIPQGLHIEGWPLDRADIVKVIPGRDTQTLERANWYLVLFNSRDSMNAYRKHVLALNSLASKNVQSSLASPIPPPPGYHVQGQDVDALLQSYTLIPPGRMVQLLPLPQEVSPSIATIVRLRGYPDIVKGPLKEPFIVMMRLEGLQVPVTMIKGALNKVEKERRMPWDVDFGSLRYHAWEARKKNVSPLDSRTKLEEHDRDDESGESNGEREKGREAEGRRERRKPRAAYMFGFNSEDKALTFVQFWHRRSIHLPGFVYEYDEIPPTVDAELLW